MTSQQRKKPTICGALFTLFVCLAILAGGVGAAWFLQKTKSTPKRAPRQSSPPMVATMAPERGDASIIVEAMGVIAPARRIDLQAEVSGTVRFVAQDLTPGGVVKKGRVLVRLDERDLALEVEKREIDVAAAEADLALEQGKQVVAREELRMLRRNTGRSVESADLALRKPQLRKAEAALDKARLALEKARLDLSRVVVRAPFNALVASLDVNQGSQVSPQTRLAELVGADEFWVEASTPLDRLDNIDFTRQGGAPVAVDSRNGQCRRQGFVARLAGDLSPDTRMARVIIRVPDPLGIKNPARSPLLLGEYVTARIQGEPLRDVIKLPRQALRMNDTIWLLVDGRLDIRQVDPVWKSRDYVYLRQGVDNDEAVILSELASPIQGMPLAREGEAAARNVQGPGVAGQVNGKKGDGAKGGAESDRNNETDHDKKNVRTEAEPSSIGRAAVTANASDNATAVGPSAERDKGAE